MHKNRSPCLSLTGALTFAVVARAQQPTLLQESVAGQTDASQQLRETRLPERANVTLSEVTQGGKKVTRFKCDIAKVDIVNRNGRYYPRSAYEAAITAAQEDLDAGKLWGLLEHADDWYDPMKGRLEKIAGRFDKLSIDGDMVTGEGVIVETASGQDLRALFEGGIAVGISTSGTASVQWLPAKEVAPDHHDPEALIGVIQDDYRLLTVDFVSDPANPSGQARASERTQRPAAGSPAPTRPQEGNMHPKIKALLEKHGVNTVDELKKIALDEYTATLEAIAKESAAPQAPTGATADGTVSLDAYRALETNVVKLTNQVTDLTTQLQNERRDGIAITALEAAKLPSSGTVKDGETEIDLDASFRAELIDVARSAESDDKARESVAAKITQRRAIVGQRESAGKRPGLPENRRPNLPTGDNSREAKQGERGAEGKDARHYESTRRSAGLR